MRTQWTACPACPKDAVAPGGTFDYDFVAPDAGTYWYHSHNRSFEQVARGLYGPLIVEENDAPEVDREEVLVLDDWRLERTGELAAGFGDPHDMSHGGRMGNYITTNGRSDLSLPVQRNARLRLRLINAANARVFPLALSGLRGWIVALDGMPLDAPRPVEGEFLLAPAQRADLIVDVTAEDGAEAYLTHLTSEGGFAQVTFPVSGTAARSLRPAPAPLPPNRSATPELAGATAVTLKMEGGAMGGMAGGMMNGRRMGAREMARAGQYWTFNGTAGQTDAPLASLSRGESVRMTIANDTRWPHGMHLHGMHFHEARPDGALGDMRDTTLLMGGETREIAFVADNPGDWLLHCHMLGHAASGMQTWIRVA